MSIQEMRSRLHQLVETVDDKLMLEDASLILSGQLTTLSHLTQEQRRQLDQAIQEHKENKTVSHEEMKQRHREWLNK
ncbi:hypothetical protein [Spirosoma validum]|uniref:Uncharacterized protein n=1 Tax=Spirosoma validum TaxID=2771355 RepID=A0A927B0L2_9BACT|nr:hypothetical protein [Spirosoma validum]MBD2753223.1 hypothetical protein [Spirosoma validum]